MTENEPDPGFVSALRGELVNRMERRSVSVSAPHPGLRTASSETLRRRVGRRVSLITAVTVLVVVGVSAAVIAGAGARPSRVPAAPVSTPMAGAADRLLIATRVPDARSDVGYSDPIGVNAAGCVTFGDRVLVAAPGSTINDDGSITVMGFGSYRVGDKPLVGGAVLDATSELLPADASSCEGTKYFFAFRP